MSNTPTMIPGTNIPAPVQPTQEAPVQPLVTRSGHTMTKEEAEEYKKKWNETLEKANKNLEDAVKLMQFEPAILTYFGLCDLKPVKDPQVTLRLNCRGTGAAINM